MVYDGILIGLIVGFIRAGFRNGLQALSEVRIRGGLIFPVLLLFQFLLIFLQDHSQFLAQNNGYLFLLVYFVGLYVVWLNRHEKGFWFIFAGVALNTLVMLVNGGRMPVSEEAASVLDPYYLKMLKEDPVVYKHILMTESTRLPFLGDIISLSAPYPRRQAISIGDVIMNFGIFIYLQKVMLVYKVQAALVEIK
ncbi:DUF5317 domain-containing protein [Paenibacillus sedimenti]|uniref:DUF5317 domain-containing protein n=1 Tax=Paenibacillus sedimenti TaxID=2770274 RepID=A0A926KSB0_9BACL|nr:DUF5317 domain-containing protein [Paenibacillus sedimenti]MBD0383192.1 DUF5317 domain-containing protein [Paenibacillus sedimenti]